MPMILDEFQRQAVEFDITPKASQQIIDALKKEGLLQGKEKELEGLFDADFCEHFSIDVGYYLEGLSGEIGEILNKHKKLQRDGDGTVTKAFVKEVESELGDALWYFALIAEKLGLWLSDIAKGNIKKLSIRKKRGTLKGSGGNR